MQYVDCKKYSKEILDRIKSRKHDKKLAIITVGNDPASESYVKGKIKDCEYCGIGYEHIKLPEDTIEWKLHETIRLYGDKREDVCGVILQLPLPKHLGRSDNYTSSIPRQKDVDGFLRDALYQPCTPAGIVYILEKELGDLSGKNVLIIGRGKLVGLPLFNMLLKKDCTITLAHSKTNNLEELLQRNDIIVSAVGKANFIDLSKCKAEIVVDVGVNRNEEGKLCGDCYNFVDTGDGMKVTPIPKGIGLMTRAMLMANCDEAEDFGELLDKIF